ncbi:hypothetical protein ACET3Z_024809 [Daucus carota]
MYVTRPLSYYRSNPESRSLPPDGPNSGYVVLEDEDSVTYSCFGMSKDRKFIDLPFPQNKNLTTTYSSGKHRHYQDVIFFPVINQPLSSNLYYVIESHGKHKGKAYACSTEEDMMNTCCCDEVEDVKPRTFDPRDTYQQFEIANYKNGGFLAKSVAHGALPPYFLRRKGWEVESHTLRSYTLGEALGLDSTLHARLPDLNFPLPHQSSKVVVIGKWYCPFMFIKDDMLTSRDQMANSVFYEMTLEQRWEQIFERDVVQREVVWVGGKEAVWDENNVVDNTMWFKSFGIDGEEVSVGLSLEIVERMKWEEERVGWFRGDDRMTRVDRVEEFERGAEGWRKFGCFVLVESFVLKRMDGSVVMTYNFKHTHQIKCLWE